MQGKSISQQCFIDKFKNRDKFMIQISSSDRHIYNGGTKFKYIFKFTIASQGWKHWVTIWDSKNDYWEFIGYVANGIFYKNKYISKKRQEVRGLCFILNKSNNEKQKMTTNIHNVHWCKVCKKPKDLDHSGACYDCQTYSGMLSTHWKTH